MHIVQVPAFLLVSSPLWHAQVQPVACEGRGDDLWSNSGSNPPIITATSSAASV